MLGRCRTLSIIIAIIGHLNGQSDSSKCNDDLAKYDLFHKKLSSVDVFRGDNNLYKSLNREHNELRRIINEGGCEQFIIDSISIKLAHWFAKKVVLEKGDIPNYIAILKETSEKSKSILELREFEDGSDGEDFYRRNRDSYLKESERLEEKYGELVIAFERSKRLTNMGVVKNNNDQPAVDTREIWRGKVGLGPSLIV